MFLLILACGIFLGEFNICNNGLYPPGPQNFISFSSSVSLQSLPLRVAFKALSLPIRTQPLKFRFNYPTLLKYLPRHTEGIPYEWDTLALTQPVFHIFALHPIFSFSLAVTLWDIPLSRPLKNTLLSLTLPFSLVTLTCRKLKPQKPNYSPCSEAKHGQREMLNCAYCYYLKFMTQFSKWLSDLFQFWLSFSLFFSPTLPNRKFPPSQHLNAPYSQLMTFHYLPLGM